MREHQLSGSSVPPCVHRRGVGIWEQVRLYLARPCDHAAPDVAKCGTCKPWSAYSLAAPRVDSPTGACRSRWLAVEVQDLLNWWESSLEVDAVDLDTVLTKPAVEGIL